MSSVNYGSIDVRSVNPVPSEMTWAELTAVSNVAISAMKGASIGVYSESFDLVMILISNVLEKKRAGGFPVDPEILDGDLIGNYCVCLSLERLRRNGKIAMKPMTIKEIFSGEDVACTPLG